jgi:hypothetical protein
VNSHGHGEELLEGADSLQQDHHRPSTLHSFYTRQRKLYDGLLKKHGHKIFWFLLVFTGFEPLINKIK